VFNEERAKQACASEPRQHRIQQRASAQRSACIRLEAETEQCQGLERRKAQQRIMPSTACCILLSAIKFKWRQGFHHVSCQKLHHQLQLQSYLRREIRRYGDLLRFVVLDVIVVVAAVEDYSRLAALNCY
jgi:hypothetical protein